SVLLSLFSVPAFSHVMIAAIRYSGYIELVMLITGWSHNDPACHWRWRARSEATAAACALSTWPTDLLLTRSNKL
ncbi:hypothetical protein LXA25_18125, partial [Erwinia amylovora]|uniref:hypothetical protein n=1 Tax=Erwinia amylovora TaxID=552 RepID=UPI0020BF5766